MITPSLWYPFCFSAVATTFTMSRRFFKYKSSLVFRGFCSLHPLQKPRTMTQSKVFDQTFVLSILLRSGAVRGGQPLTGVQGCPLVLSLSLAPPAAAREK